LRGKILNVANATAQKLAGNKELSDLTQALGVGIGVKYKDDDLRYERVIVMTDADIDGAHIASLLITFFYQEMPELIENGHLYLAVPPLYKLSGGGQTVYARDDAHRNELLETVFKGKKPETTRFKGLGEMDYKDLKSTTMDPAKRRMLKVEVLDADKVAVADSVNALMGSKPELRFRFIQDRAAFARDLDI
jgi:topoisomerase IV subunit B